MNPLNPFKYGISTDRKLYKYQPLGKNEIRLLKYVETSTGVQWQFEHVSLDAYPEYMAISYTWGRDSYAPRAIIEIDNGSIVEVGDSAVELLFTLRQYFLEIPIWIDAICMNQADHQEKFHQIPLMRRVYSQAASVSVYLGAKPGRDSKEKRIAALIPVKEILSFDGGGNVESSQVPEFGEAVVDMPEVVKLLSEMESSSNKSHVQYGRSLPGALLRQQDLICDILNKPWWQRLWTMQEYVLAKKVLFFYGDIAIEDEVLRRYVDLYEELNLAEVESLMSPVAHRFLFGGAHEDSDLDILHEVDARSALPELQLLRGQLMYASENDKPDIEADIHVLTSAFNHRATIATDKILGMLGMLQGGLSDMIPITPAATQLDIYKPAARYVLTNPSNHENLALLHYIDTLDRLEDAPSWTPNFHSRLRTTPLSPFRSPSRFLYRPSWTSRAQFQILKAADSIALKGCILDTIDEIVDRDTHSWTKVIPPGLHYSCREQLAFERSCRQLAASVTARHLSDRSRLDHAISKYCATLVAGSRRQGTQYIPWSPSVSAYKAWTNRLTTLADPSYDFLHNSRNPGTFVNRQFIGKMRGMRSPGIGMESDLMEVGGEPEEFHQRFYEVCTGRVFFSTKHGRFGLGPSGANGVITGDMVVVFEGARTPFVIREIRDETGDGKAYRVIGEAYVHGLMYSHEEKDGVGTEETESTWLRII